MAYAHAKNNQFHAFQYKMIGKVRGYGQKISIDTIRHPPTEDKIL